MATTLTRTKSNSKPEYKDYVSFLDSYRNGGGAAASQKDDQISVDSGFPLSNATSSSSLSNGSSDVTDFAKSYEHFRENSKNRKFTPVRLDLDLHQKKQQQQQVVKKSELFIEINNDAPVPQAKKVSEVSKIFEKNIRFQNPKKGAISSKLGSKINVFEKPAAEKQMAKPPVLVMLDIPPPLEFSEQQVHHHPPPPLEFSNNETRQVPVTMDSPPLPPPPPPAMFENRQEARPKIAEKPMSPPPPPPPPMSGFVIPPPPQFAGTASNNIGQKANNNYQKTSSNSVNGINRIVVNRSSSLNNGKKNGANGSGTTSGNGSNFNKNGIDMNDPMVKKLVYGTLRGMYGAQHQKANGIVATLPRDMVKKDNNIQNIIEAIASSGGLDKLKGRANPKVDADQN